MNTMTEGLATVASRVRYARELAGLSQRQLSVAAGLSHSTVNCVEAGTADTRLGTVEAIARALGVSRDWLLTGLGEPPKRKEAAP